MIKVCRINFKTDVISSGCLNHWRLTQEDVLKSWISQNSIISNNIYNRSTRPRSLIDVFESIVYRFSCKSHNLSACYVLKRRSNVIKVRRSVLELKDVLRFDVIKFVVLISSCYYSKNIAKKHFRVLIVTELIVSKNIVFHNELNSPSSWKHRINSHPTLIQSLKVRRLIGVICDMNLCVITRRNTFSSETHRYSKYDLTWMRLISSHKIRLKSEIEWSFISNNSRIWKSSRGQAQKSIVVNVYRTKFVYCWGITIRNWAINCSGIVKIKEWIRHEELVRFIRINKSSKLTEFNIVNFNESSMKVQRIYKYAIFIWYLATLND